MVYKIIWADGVALRGAEAAVGYEELGIVTTKRTHKTMQMENNLAKLSLLKGCHLIKSKIGKKLS